MTQSRVRVRVLALALAVAACVLAGVLPATAKDGARGAKKTAVAAATDGRGHGAHGAPRGGNRGGHGARGGHPGHRGHGGGQPRRGGGPVSGNRGVQRGPAHGRPAPTPRRQGAARGNVRRNGAARGNVRRNGASRGTVRRRGAVRGNVRRNGAARGNVRRNGAARGNVRRRGTTGGTVRRRGAVRGNVRRSGAARGNVRRNGVARGNVRRNGTTGGNVRSNVVGLGQQRNGANQLAGRGQQGRSGVPGATPPRGNPGRGNGNRGGAPGIGRGHPGRGNAGPGNRGRGNLAPGRRRGNAAPGNRGGLGTPPPPGNATPGNRSGPSIGGRGSTGGGQSGSSPIGGRQNTGSGNPPAPDRAGSGRSGATPQPARPQPSEPSGRSDGGNRNDRSGERSAPRRRAASRPDRSVSGVRPQRRATSAPAPPTRFRPAPVIRRTPSGRPAVAPLGEVALDPRPSARRERPAAGRATGFRAAEGGITPVTRTVERIVEVTPGWLKAALIALGVVALVFAIHSFFASARARGLARQREQLLDEVGLLQAALLPAVPERMGELGSTVAYRPADGPGAGGDFYDVFPFDGGRVGVIVGDVSGHGRESLARTALMRYTLRAYLDAGLTPRAALKVAGGVLDEDLGDDFATVVLAVYDPEAGTLTYACAGHPPPILLGPTAHEPVTSYSSPPIGVGATTGLRQTTVGLPPGSVACFYTDGLAESRAGGELFGRERLAELLAELGPEVTAQRLLDRVAAVADRTPDDMAAAILTPHEGQAALLRVEELEVAAGELGGDAVPRFLRDCGLATAELPAICREAADVARASGTAILRVRLGDWRPGVDVLPGNVESFTATARRRSAAIATP